MGAGNKAYAGREKKRLKPVLRGRETTDSAPRNCRLAPVRHEAGHSASDEKDRAVVREREKNRQVTELSPVAASHESTFLR